MAPNRFKEMLLQKDQFIYTVELVPGRGARGRVQEDVLAFADQAARGGLIHALSITDNPGGHPALAPEVIGFEIGRMGIDPVIHFTCKDKNRNQIESILYAFDRIGIHNLLVMTGDFPLYGFEGKAKPVFDLDSVQLLHLLNMMNKGLEVNSNAPGGGTILAPTHTFKGCAVSPFKKLESETMGQYFKLFKKVRAGADFITTQVGYDARKFDELLRYMRYCGIKIPVLGNVYILKFPVARTMNRKNIPGCVVTDDLCRTCEEECSAPDKGRAASLERAARQIALLRGIGYSGVHIGGFNLKYKDVEWVIGRSAELYPDWTSFVSLFDYPQPGGFYLYEKDLKTGLNTDIFSGEKERPGKSPGYALMRLFHRMVFVQGTPIYKAARSLFKAVDGTKLEGFFTEIEYLIKLVSSRCRRCGDCTLPDMAFLCPQSQCAKSLLNGPCGGSVDGWCEVFPGKRQCIYVRAYERLKSYNEEASLKDDYICPRDWSLDQTSSWANYFLDRDHHNMATCKK